MRRFVFAVFACLLSSFWARASGDVWLDDFPGNDQMKAEAAIPFAIRDPDNCARLHFDFKPGTLSPSGRPRTSRSFYRPLLVKDPLGRLLYGLTIIGDGTWASFRTSADGDGLTVDGAKSVRFVDFTVLRTGPVPGRGVVVIARGSCNPVFTNFMAQNCTVGLDIVGGTADVSRAVLWYANFTDCAIGTRMSGANALDYDCRYVTGSNCKDTLIDCTQGGSESVIDHPGGSSCGSVVKVNAGYRCNVYNLTSELNKGPVVEAVGYDQGGFVVVENCLDNRSIAPGMPLLRAGCSFKIDLGGRKDYLIEGRMEGLTGEATITGTPARVVLTGPWNLNGVPWVQK